MSDGLFLLLLLLLFIFVVISVDFPTWQASRVYAHVGHIKAFFVMLGM